MHELTNMQIASTQNPDIKKHSHILLEGTPPPHTHIGWVSTLDKKTVRDKYLQGLFAAAKRLTKDHKADDVAERRLVLSRGGKVTYPCGGIGRVNGNLAVTRSLGDRKHKPYVSSEPELGCHAICSGDEFVILASDGLWDVLTDQAAVRSPSFNMNILPSVAV